MPTVQMNRPCIIQIYESGFCRFYCKSGFVRFYSKGGFVRLYSKSGFGRFFQKAIFLIAFYYTSINP